MPNAIFHLLKGDYRLHGVEASDLEAKMGSGDRATAPMIPKPYLEAHGT